MAAVMEVRMDQPDFWNGDALQWVHQKHPRDQVSCPWGQVRWQVVDPSCQVGIASAQYRV